ncbi:hypothetical protein GFL80_14965 [Rhizobium leguminosarum bv. viciae]|uniref:hypothetical protein n=1 Tax=Rhizobium leguminosarum TaxID=384 RepID=UPI001441E1EE|nr:hypothetical protein [Rhizobium leguminosarum]NKK85537.1 hypothetical protein [Rhizobium leguminosarum bv. viciae]
MNGVDVRQVILAENVERRHMSKGQRAMAVAMMYPEAVKGGKRTKGAVLETKTEAFSPALLSQARAVLAHSKPLADAVLAAVKPLEFLGGDIGDTDGGDLLALGHPGGLALGRTAAAVSFSMIAPSWAIRVWAICKPFLDVSKILETLPSPSRTCFVTSRV